MAERSSRPDLVEVEAADLPPASHPAIEQLLVHTEGTLHTLASEVPAASLAPGLHIGKLEAISGRTALVSLDGVKHEASLAPHVDPNFLRAALEDVEPVLLQKAKGGGLAVMGVLQGKFPSRLIGDRVEVTGGSEVVVQSGKSALRLREDGVVDLIGARISASSRGLLRLVGRALRLN